MSIQPISNPSAKPSNESFILPKAKWVGKQISLLGKTIYSQLTKITNLFYQTIKAHSKKTLAILIGSAIILLIYYKEKSSFLKLESQKKTLQQKINDLSKQASGNLEELQKQFTLLDRNIIAISSSQKIMQDKHAQIEDKYEKLKNDFDSLLEPIPQSASSEEKIVYLETQIKNLQDFEPRIQEFIEETDIYKNNLSDSKNPF